MSKRVIIYTRNLRFGAFEVIYKGKQQEDCYEIVSAPYFSPGRDETDLTQDEKEILKQYKKNPKTVTFKYGTYTAQKV